MRVRGSTSLNSDAAATAPAAPVPPGTQCATWYITASLAACGDCWRMMRAPGMRAAWRRRGRRRAVGIGLVGEKGARPMEEAMGMGVVGRRGRRRGLLLPLVVVPLLLCVGWKEGREKPWWSGDMS